MGGHQSERNFPDEIFTLTGQLFPMSCMFWGVTTSHEYIAFYTRGAALDALSVACVAGSKSQPVAGQMLC